MDHFEKLGVFYLGQPAEPDQKTKTDDHGYFLYPSKNLTTHAVCVGMTGSGKTGLCVGLLEEAAMDGIPALVIDPKGDMTNLMLTFPDLAPGDFRPWIHEDDARKAGVSPDAYAAQEAEKWKKGLSQWGQDGERIRKMRETTEFAVYTPGSSAGLPVSILQSFKAPSQSVMEDRELLQEQVSGVAGSLLSLIGLEADPIRSREHILIANILLTAWQAGQDLALGDLIQLIQEPPFSKVGVMDRDMFYPQNDRLDLALRFNNLLASPGFASWLEGEPLDIGRLLYTSSGKPRLSVLSIAHLTDAERMFFVSLLLNQVVSWARSQPGTSSLRALLYMDEIFGYFPPVANPPSKAPLLTLLKQARAYGLGVVLTTQNPVDLDYKGLANAGTWFIGRLQTERDKERLIEGLEGAMMDKGQSMNRSEIEKLLSGLKKRVFLMHSVYHSEPLIFETRWCLSYLCGPLTRKQIQQIDQDYVRQGQEGQASVKAVPVPGGIPEEPALEPKLEAKPVSYDVPDDVRVVHAPLRKKAENVYYKPYVLGIAQIGYADRKYDVYHQEAISVVTPITTGVFSVNWDEAEELALDLEDFSTEGIQKAHYADLPDAAKMGKNYTVWKKDFVDWAYRTCHVELLQNEKLEMVAKPGETERDFRIRLQQKAREARDEATEELRRKYEKKMNSLEEKIRKAEWAVEREKEQAKQQKMQTAISLGATLLSAFLGKKAVSASSVGRATTAARGASRVLREEKDVTRYKENVETYQKQLKELELEFEQEAESLTEAMDPMSQDLDTVMIKPYKKDILPKDLVLAWMPFDKEGQKLFDDSQPE